MNPVNLDDADRILGRIFPAHEHEYDGAGHCRCERVAELTPHSLTVDEGAAARTAFDLALRVRYMEMHNALRGLPYEALRDVELAHSIFGSTLRVEIAERRPALVAAAALSPDELPDTLKVPCGRCGHEENLHGEGAHKPIVAARLCIGCGGFCSSVVVKQAIPAGVEGWAIQGRAE